jgi:hypothetical protein
MLVPGVFWANLMYLILRVLKLSILRVRSKQVMTKNVEKKILLNDFHRRTDLKTLLFSTNFGVQKKCCVFKILKSKFHTSFDKEWGKNSIGSTGC